MTPALPATAGFASARAASILVGNVLIHTEYHAAAESFGEPGREKNIFDRIGVDCSGDPLHGADAAHGLAGSHRPPRQGEDAGDNLRRGAQVQRR